jgi:hypothetical protein
MKKIYSLLSIALTGVSFAQQTVPVYEPFNYTVGSTINSQSPWIGAVASPDDALITAGNLSYTGLPTSAGNSITFSENGFDPQLTFVSQATLGNTVYASFIMNISSIPVTLTDAAGTHFAGLGQSSTNFSSTLWFRKDAVDGTKFNLGINKATTIADTQWLTTQFNQNESILIVLGYTLDATASTSKLWVNPALGGAEPATTATATVGANRVSIDRFYLRQDNVTKTPTIIVDELRVGANWTDATSTTALLGSSSFSQIDGLKMYPNPTKNNLFIETALNSDINVSIVNMLGKEVVNANVVNNTVNVSSLTSGIYIVKITEEGKTSTKKLIIE